MRVKLSLNIIKKQIMCARIFVLFGLLILTTNGFAQDPNFYIYLCFGQSNMEGQGTIEQKDRTVYSRFQLMQAVNCSNLGRTKGTWYNAIPPLCRCWNGLCPADYFGKTMVENIPDSIRIGVINVSVGGCRIELFDKDIYQDYDSTHTDKWFLDIIKAYDGNPYGYLIDLAKLAQEDGIIKGILLHQGESNTGDNQWPSKVKKIYEDMMDDLDLDPDATPLLAGEVVHADQGGICASMNSIIAKLPQTLPHSYVISSSGCTAKEDKIHFNSAGYRELGRRYAAQILSLMGYESIYLEPECGAIGENWEILSDNEASNGRYVTVKSGMQSLSEAPTDSESVIFLHFSVNTHWNFSVFSRLNCSTDVDDSYWIKMDNGDFSMCDGLLTSGWQWIKLNNYDLAAGEHTLTIAYREDGAKLDKICVSSYSIAPTGLGEEAENICDHTGIVNLTEVPDGYVLEQNYPNPFNPKTSLRYYLPQKSKVTLEVLDITGRTVKILIDNVESMGEYTITFDVSDLSSGIYFYRLRTLHGFMQSKKMLLVK